MKINSDENKRCQLYLKQEKEINKYYSEKKSTFKNFIEEKISLFKDKFSDFKLFSTVLIQYNDVIQKNIENIKKALSNFESHDKSQNPKILDLESILSIQEEGEKEKRERLNLSPEFKKKSSEFEKKGKELINILNRYYTEYANLIDKLNRSHLGYLRNFNDFEIKMIVNETKETQETEEENLEQINPKEDTFLMSLHNKEYQYKNNLEHTNNEFKVITQGMNKCIDELNKINKEMEKIMENNMYNIYLGFAASNKMQKFLEQKFMDKKQTISGEIKDNNIKEMQNNNEITIEEENSKSKIETMLKEIKFSSYNLLSPYANIPGYKQQNMILAKLKPEIIYKISCIINSEFNYIPKVDLKEQYEIMDVKLICQRILDSTPINKTEEEQLYKYLEQRKYSLAFLAALNNTRSSGKFLLKKKLIIILGNAYKIIVDKLYKENNIDFEILKYLIIMSQTYYALSSNGKDKVYLIRFIEDSPYFKSESLWNNYIVGDIEHEIDAQESKNLWNFESDESEKFKINQIYFGKLISYTQGLMDFRIDKKLVYKIIHNLIDTKYKIAEEFIKHIDSLIENTNYDITMKFDPDKDILNED